jgi:hypothetical protein
MTQTPRCKPVKEKKMKTKQQKQNEAVLRKNTSDTMTPYGKLVACDGKPGDCRRERFRLWKAMNASEQELYRAYLNKMDSRGVVIPFPKVENV